MSNTTKSFPVIRNRPVARFRYKGTHSKPVRREIRLTKVTRDIITGYEVREGNETRPMDKAIIKSYSRDKIKDLERLPLSACEW